MAPIAGGHLGVGILLQKWSSKSPFQGGGHASSCLGERADQVRDQVRGSTNKEIGMNRQLAHRCSLVSKDTKETVPRVGIWNSSHLREPVENRQVGQSKNRSCMATPLPLNPFLSDLSGRPYRAYQKCIDLESLAPTNLALQRSSPPGLVAARLLGYLLVHSENGRPKLAREIINASDDATLVSLARHYIAHFVKVCMYTAISVDDMLTLLPVKRASGPTPAPSDHPSRPSFEAERESLVSTNDPASLDHRKSKQAVRFSLFL